MVAAPAALTSARERYDAPERLMKRLLKSKEYPYCISAVPLKAVRCPHCTSELKAA